MIRKAVLDDMEQIGETDQEHFAYEMEHGAVTVFRKDIYPTRKDAERAVRAGTLYVCEENNKIAGSIIVDRVQPEKYAEIVWRHAFPDEEVMVIHLLMARPGMAGKGIPTALAAHALELAKAHGCKAVRLDTGSQNIPAVSFYKKLGFQIAATASMKVGNAIEHEGHLFLEKVLGTDLM